MWFMYNLYQTRSRCMLYLASLGSSQTAIRTGWYFCTVVLHHPGRSSVCRLVFQLIQHLIQIIKDLALMRLIDQTLSAGQEQKPACPAGLQYTLRVNGGTLPLLSPYITHYAYGTMDWTCWEQVSTRRSTVLT